MPAASHPHRLRRRYQDTSPTDQPPPRPRLFQQLSCLWKAPVGPDDGETRVVVKAQPSSSTLLVEDWEESSSSEQGEQEETVHTTPNKCASPQEWLTYYKSRIPFATDWTERANLYYTTGHLAVQCQDVLCATHAFEQEAAVLHAQPGVPKSALVPIYTNLAKLWTVRQPNKALHYYRTALSHATCPHDMQDIRHAMGRLYFNTGNLEQAMRIGGVRL